MSQDDSNSGSTPTPTLVNTEATAVPVTEEVEVPVPVTEPTEVDDTDFEPDLDSEEKPFDYITPLGYKSKLNLTQLIDFGFADADETLSKAIRGAAAATKVKSSIDGGGDIEKSKSKNQTVGYGGTTDFDDDDDDVERDYAADNDESDEDEVEDEEEEEEQEVEVEAEEFQEEADTTDDLWEELEDDDDDNDEQEEMDAEEYEEELAEALAREEEEYKRQRAIKNAEINRKKAILIESYLKIAPVMIAHRKKNIYLQDYLYNLASRKGILRGDIHTTSSNASTEEGKVNSKALKEQQRKEDAMNRRIDKLIEEAGHFEGISEQGPNDEDDEKHGHHHDHGIKIRNHHFLLAKILRESGDGTAALQIREKPKEKVLALKKAWLMTKEGHRQRDTRVTRLMKVAGDALSAFKKRRCRREKQKQIIILQNFLRQKDGTEEDEEDDTRDELDDSEQQSDKKQNRAKTKAPSSQSKKEPSQEEENAENIADLNEKWTQALERIRELRLKKAKLEEEERLLLMKKMEDWEFWAERNLAAVQGVYEFITDIGNRVAMTRAETESYRQGLDLFQKQVFTLHQSMFQQVERSYKIKSDLYLLQRKAKNLEETGSGEAEALNNFTTSDFKRMTLENEEARQKLIARQIHLAEEQEKLKVYMEQVAKSFKTKHNLLSVLHTGKHNLKYLWELCIAEKENLMQKLAEMRGHEKHYRQSFVLISLLENKRCLAHFESLEYNVQQLKSRQRELQTQLSQTECTLRILNVRYTDMRQRLRSEHREKAEKARKENFDQQKARMRKQLAPRPPQTLYGLLAAGCDDSAEDEYLKTSITGGLTEVKSANTYSEGSGSQTTKKKSTKLPLVIN